MHILIIEDDQFIRRVYTQVLSQEGFQVSIAEDGEKGLQMAEELRPDVILLDIILPKKNGFEVLQDLRDNPEMRNTPVVIFSALKQETDIEKAMKLGATKYLPKAIYSLREIVDEIKKYQK